MMDRNMSIHALLGLTKDVALKRSIEIATKGYSETSVPEAKNSQPPQDVSNALLIVEQALMEQNELLHGLTVRLYHTVQIAERRLKDDDSDLAIASMRKVMTAQNEYVHILRLILGIEALEHHLELGLVDVNDVKSNIEDIKKAPWDSKPCKASDKEVLSQLKEKHYFPLLLPEGMISFSEIPNFSNGKVDAAAKARGAVTNSAA